MPRVAEGSGFSSVLPADLLPQAPRPAARAAPPRCAASAGPLPSDRDRSPPSGPSRSNTNILRPRSKRLFFPPGRLGGGLTLLALQAGGSGLGAPAGGAYA